MAETLDNQPDQPVLADEPVLLPPEGAGVRSLYALAGSDIWPELSDPLRPVTMGRGQFLKLMLVTVAALTLGGVKYEGDRLAERGKQTKRTIEMYLQAKFAGLPSQEQLVADIPYGRNIVYTLRLNDMQRKYNMTGPISIRAAAVGTSMSYGLGTMNDRTGPLNQDHSVLQRGFGGLSPAARQLLGMDIAGVRTDAVPGADSGWGNSQDPRGLYGLLTQLSNRDMRDWLMAVGPNELSVLRYETFGLDDLRKLAVTIREFSGLINDFFQFLTDDTFTAEAKGYIDMLDTKLKGIALDFANNMIQAAAMVYQLNQQLRLEGKPEMPFVAVYSPNVGKGDRIPFSAIDGNNDDPNIRNILKPDIVDVDFLNRWFLDLNAMPFGHEIATWAWTLMFQAQNAALTYIQKHLPDLLVPIELQLDVNEGDDFYPVKRPDGLWIPEGDGHAGIVVGGTSGLEKSGKAALTVYQRDEVTADQLAEFEPYVA